MSMEDVLGERIDKELLDENFAGRTHGRPSCYNAGCRGELCRYGMRVYLAERRGAVQEPRLTDAYLLLRLTQHRNERENLIA